MTASREFFPARVAFAKDRRKGPTHMAVYEYCVDEFDFCEKTHRPLDSIEVTLGVDRSHIAKALTWLVEHGYLTEHERGHQNSRFFTLRWSVRQTVAKSATDSHAVAS